MQFPHVAKITKEETIYLLDCSFAVAVHLVHITVKLFILSWITNERELIMPQTNGYIIITSLNT